MVPPLWKVASPRKRRTIGALMLLTLGGVATGLAALAAAASSAMLVSPPRRAVQDHQKAILEDPRRHGLDVTPFSGGGNTPALLCLPHPQPGEAIKGMAVRTELEARGVPVPPWGRIHGSIVMLHGHSGRKEEMLAVAERFCAAGFRCLLIDLPAHGENPAPVGTFGVKESELPLRLLREAGLRFGFDSKQASLFGLSMGGCVAAEAARKDPGVWQRLAAVSTFTELKPVIAGVLRPSLGRAVFLEEPAFLLCNLGTFVRAGFFPSSIRPVDTHRDLDLPRMFVHGCDDTYIPLWHGEKLAEAARGSVLIRVPGGNHTNTLMQGGVSVYAELCKFYLASGGRTAR